MKETLDQKINQILKIVTQQADDLGSKTVMRNKQMTLEKKVDYEAQTCTTGSDCYRHEKEG